MLFIKTISRYLISTAIIIFLFFELWVVIVNNLTDTSLPENLGNFPGNIKRLREKKPGDNIRFAVIGDSRSEGTMEDIARNLQESNIDFGVLVGDIAFSGSEDEHRWLRNEIRSEWNLKYPLFYLIGNHDIDFKNYPISRFEQEYGKNIFSMEYGNCLFIFLRVWNSRGLDYEESLSFLRELSKKDLTKYHKRFVFMHQSPPIPTLAPVTDFTNTDEFIQLFKKMKIDYVFASDFHGYAWTRYQGTIYNITGGGGAKLVKTFPLQFHHALIFEVGKDYVSKQFVVVNKHVELEDHFERLAFVALWPFFKKHLYFTSLINVSLLIILGWIFASFHNKKQLSADQEDFKQVNSNQRFPVFYKYITFLILLIFLLVTFQLISSYDYEWTTFFRQHRNDTFRHLIENTVFKGQVPGLRDLATIMFIVSGLLYLLSFIKNKSAKLKLLRPCFSLILISGLACLLFTHSIKNGMSRPRPKDVYAQKVGFSSWYEFGPDIIPHSTYRASMPSGHTTMVAVLISLAYALFLIAKKSILKVAGIFLLIFFLLLTITMGVSRSMSAHWVSDTIVSLFGCWAMIHIVYYLIRSRKIKKTAKAYLLADLNLCLRLVLFFIGVLLTLWGIHAMQIKLSWYSLLILLIIPGVTGISFALYQQNINAIFVWPFNAKHNNNC